MDGQRFNFLQSLLGGTFPACPTRWDLARLPKWIGPIQVAQLGGTLQEASGLHCSPKSSLGWTQSQHGCDRGQTKSLSIFSQKQTYPGIPFCSYHIDHLMRDKISEKEKPLQHLPRVQR